MCLESPILVQLPNNNIVKKNSMWQCLTWVKGLKVRIKENDFNSNSSNGLSFKRTTMYWCKGDTRIPRIKAASAPVVLRNSLYFPDSISKKKVKQCTITKNNSLPSQQTIFL